MDLVNILGAANARKIPIWKLEAAMD
jgi:hypothetical protein